MSTDKTTEEREENQRRYEWLMNMYMANVSQYAMRGLFGEVRYDPEAEYEMWKIKNAQF